MSDQNVPFVGRAYGTASLIAHWEARRRKSQVAAFFTASRPLVLRAGLVDTGQVISPPRVPSEEAASRSRIRLRGEILVQAEIVVFGDRTSEGQLIQAVTIAW